MPYPPNKQAWTLFFDLLIPFGVAAPVAYLVLPISAARKVGALLLHPEMPTRSPQSIAAWVGAPAAGQLLG